MAEGGEAGRGGPRLFGGFQLWNFKAKEWKTAAWLGAVLVVGLILLSARPAGAPARGTAASAGAPSPSAPADAGADPLAAEAAAIDQDIAAALSQVAGAGRVTVRVHLRAGPRTDYATNQQDSDSTTSETSSGAGLQTTTQQTTSSQVAVTSGGAAVVQDVQAPVVDGVLVVATGASSATVAAELAAAAQAVTGAPIYRITVLPADPAAPRNGLS